MLSVKILLFVYNMLVLAMIEINQTNFRFSYVPMVGAWEKLDASEIPMGFPCVFLAAPAHAGLEYVLQSWSGNPIYLDHEPVMELYN